MTMFLNQKKDVGDDNFEYLINELTKAKFHEGNGVGRISMFF